MTERKKQFHCYMSAEEKAMLAALAAKLGVSDADCIRMLLRSAAAGNLKVGYDK